MECRPLTGVDQGGKSEGLIAEIQKKSEFRTAGVFKGTVLERTKGRNGETVMTTHG